MDISTEYRQDADPQDGRRLVSLHHRKGYKRMGKTQATVPHAGNTTGNDMEENAKQQKTTTRQVLADVYEELIGPTWPRIISANRVHGSITNSAEQTMVCPMTLAMLTANG